MNVKIVPLGTNVVLKPVPIETQTASGIYRSDAAEVKSQKAEVVAVPTQEEISVSVGDIVLYKQYGGEEVLAEDGEKYIIIKAEDLFAIVQ